ncbi:MAG: hypothetical protein RLZZ305_425 [Actinomycetota bacterium]|jgi:hypothetical protein
MTTTGTVGDHRGWYALLGVDPASGEEEIRRAYKAAARRWHPDVNPSHDAAEVMRELNEAVRVLTDPFLRSGYDSTVPPVDHGITFVPTAVDFGDKAEGRRATSTVTVNCAVPTDDVHVDRINGTWWSATVEVPRKGDALLEIRVEADTSTVGSFTDTITLDVGGTAHVLPLRLTVRRRNPAARVLGRVLRGPAPRWSGPSGAARGRWRSGDRWESMFAVVARLGLPMCILWVFAPDLVVNSAGIVPAVVGIEEPRLHAIVSTLEPWIIVTGCVLFVTTFGATRGPAWLRVASVTVALAGWTVALIITAWLVAVALMIAVLGAAVAFLFASLAD